MGLQDCKYKRALLSPPLGQRINGIARLQLVPAGRVHQLQAAETGRRIELGATANIDTNVAAASGTDLSCRLVLCPLTYVWLLILDYKLLLLTTE
jgi:hypothetical protein